MLESIIKGFIAKHTPPVVSILVVLLSGIFYISHEVQTGFNGVKEEIVYEARKPFYLAEEYALRKQLEKISKDPADLKTSDIELSYILCADEFGTKYIKSLPANRKINAEKTCLKMADLYTSRNVY